MVKTKILSNHYPIYHLSFFVENVEEAALRHHEMFGSGPYYVMKDITVNPVYRGEKHEFHLEMATGWWGDIAIEFNSQSDEGDSYLRDNGRFGFHHVCIGVDDVKAAIEEFASYGCPVCGADLERDYPWAYIDCRSILGMYIEINPGPDPVWKIVKKEAETWDGETKVLRDVNDLRAAFGKYPELFEK